MTANHAASILVVDDHEISLELMEMMLTSDGYEVRLAASGEEALAAVEEKKPDLILLDAMMPGIDGFEVARRLKADERSRNIPIILVTVLNDRESRIVGLEAGAEEFLTKPVDRAELLIRVKNLLRINEQNEILTELVEARTAELRESEARYRRITEVITDYQYTLRVENGRDTQTIMGAACMTVTGYGADEFAADHDLWINIVAQQDRLQVMEQRRQILEGSDVRPLEHRIIRKDGEIRWVCSMAILFKDVLGRLLSCDVVFKDITERKLAEAEIRHANRALATFSAVNNSLVHATDENDLLQSICEAIVGQRGYSMAWVGYRRRDELKSIRIMACAGDVEVCADAGKLSWEDDGLCGQAIRSVITQVCQDIFSDNQCQSCRDVALKRGLASSIALPLMDEGNAVFGVLAVYSEEANAFSASEIELLEEMADNLAFGVNTLRIRRERDLAQKKVEQQFEELQDSMENTVQAIASIVEVRDPYTAGHQAMVADLAAAIAIQMDLPADQVHAIHLAGVLHDLGKVKIPAEILGHPGRLDAAESALIRRHPQTGYEILKDINFSWPVALMVLQHHECLDGSGYPQGLKGEQILLEARILRVADAIVAISSPRPYRPGLRADEALAEVVGKRGVHYDPRVVDACVTLFTEKQYKIEGLN